MSDLPIRFRPVARIEFDEAASWYERRRNGLGHEFKDEVQAILEKIAANPTRFNLVRGSTRRALLKRFPFAINKTLEQPPSWWLRCFIPNVIRIA
jgi:hypothetical protein